MKIRLSGTPDECANAVEALAAGFVLREVSGFYANRGATVLGRVYVAAEPCPEVVQATATRDDCRAVGEELPEGGAR
ncbi:MAG: hypothetical protein ACRDRK_16205 [Pseudonocardia sp.]